LVDQTTPSSLSGGGVREQLADLMVCNAGSVGFRGEVSHSGDPRLQRGFIYGSNRSDS
jgi:hypothetical protein